MIKKNLHFGIGESRFMARLVYNTVDLPGERPKQRTETVPQRTDTQATKEKTVDFKEDMKETLLALADNDRLLAENYELSLREGLANGTSPKMTLEEFWKQTQRKAESINYGKGRGLDLGEIKVKVEKGKIRFVYLKKGVEKDLTPNANTILIRAIPKVEIKLDTEKLEAEETKEQKTEEAKKARTSTDRVSYIDDDNIVHLRPGQETHNIKLAKLYPNAQEGNQLMITPKNGKGSRVVVFKDGDFVYESGPDKGKHAIILDGYKITEKTQIDYVEEKPTPPTLEKGLYFIRISQDGKAIPSSSPTEPQRLKDAQIKSVKDGTLTWNTIALELMTKYPSLRASGLSTPEYAQLLQKYSTEKGHYWIIIKAKTATAEEQAEKQSEEEIKRGKTEATRRGKEQTKDMEKRAEAAYAKYGDMVKDGTNLEVATNFYDAINDPKKWEEEVWIPYEAKIVDAFKYPPFDKCFKNPTDLKDKLREAFTVGLLGFPHMDIHDLFKYFNKSGTIYKSRSGDTSAKAMLKDYQKGLEIAKEYNKKKDEAAKKGSPAPVIKTEDRAIMDQVSSIENILKGASLIFSSLEFLRQGKKRSGRRVETVTTPQETYGGQTYNEMLLFDKKKKELFEDESTYCKDKMDKYINDPKKWRELWEHPRGNILSLKKALDRYPFSQINQDLKAEKIRKAIHSTASDNFIDMDSLLKQFNANGELLKNKDGEPITSSGDLKKEYDLRKSAGYNKKYEEIHHFLITSLQIFRSVKTLDDAAEYVEDIEASALPKATLDSIFPPTGTGSVNGEGVRGEKIGGGGVFSGGFLKWNFEEELGNIPELDLVSSNATANNIIADSTGRNAGEIKPDRLQYRLNALIKKGLAHILIRKGADTPQIKQAVEALKAQGIDIQSPISIDKVYKQLEIKFLTQKPPATEIKLTDAQRDLIKFGFVVETVLEGPKVKEATESTKESPEWKSLPEDPSAREAYLKVLESNLPADKKQKLLKTVKDNEGKIKEASKNTIIAAAGIKLNDNFKKGINTVGIGTGIPIADGLSIMGAVSYNPNTKNFTFSVGPGGSVDLGNNVSFNWGAGATTTGHILVGTGLTFTMKADPSKGEKWDDNATLGSWLDINVDRDRPLAKGASVGAGLAYVRSINADAAAEVDAKEKLAAEGYGEVEKAQTTAEKARLLKRVPGPNGQALAELAINLNLSDEDLVGFYDKHIRSYVKNNEMAKCRFLTHAGVGFGINVAVGPNQPPQLTVVPGVMFAFSIANELVLFQRQNISDSDMTAFGGNEMEQQAKKKIYESALAKASQGSIGKMKTLTFKGATMVGDKETGYRRSEAMQPTRTESATVKTDTQNEDLDKAFIKLQQEMAKNGMKITKNAKLKMYELEVGNIGNMQVYVDPQMKEKAGVFLTEDGKIMISANQNPRLVIKRLDKYYPRPVNGNVKHTIVTISDEDLHGQDAIIEDSDYFLDTRTVDQAGVKRYALSYESKGRAEPKQKNIFKYPKTKDDAANLLPRFENLDNKPAISDEQANEKLKLEEYSELAKKAQERIGTANINSLKNSEHIHGLAVEFIDKKHYYKEYRELTTNKKDSKPDIEKLNGLIKGFFNEKEGREPSFEEIMLFKVELYNLSMSEAEERAKQRGANTPEKIKAEKEKIMKERIEWAKTNIYIPFFERHLQDVPNAKFTPEQLAEAYLAPMRTAHLEGEPEALLEGMSINIAVGSGKVVGDRPLQATAGDKTNQHRLYVMKDYTNALITHQPAIDYTIALILRESHRPVESLKNDQDSFMKSPMALRLMTLGAGNNYPVLADALGTETYSRLLSCYQEYNKTNKLVHMNEATTKEAINKLMDLAKQLRAAQEGKDCTYIKVGEGASQVEYMTILVNGTRLGIRTNAIKMGAYERCLNAADVYSDDIIAFKEVTPFRTQGNFRFYSAAVAASMISTTKSGSQSFGVGATVSLKATEPETPPERQPRRPYKPAEPTTPEKPGSGDRTPAKPTIPWNPPKFNRNPPHFHIPESTSPEGGSAGRVDQGKEGTGSSAGGPTTPETDTE